MDKPNPGELEKIALRFSQTGLAGRNDPNTMMLADIIRRLSALEKMLSAERVDRENGPIPAHIPFQDGSKHAANRYCPTCHGAFDSRYWDSQSRAIQSG